MRSTYRQIAATTCLLVVAGAGAAVADTTGADGDITTTAVDTSLNFGAIPCGTTTSRTIDVWVTRVGAVNNQTFGNSALLAVSAAALASPVSAGTSTIQLPSNWTTIGNNVRSSVASLTVSVTPTETGSGNQGISVNAAGSGATTASVSRSTPLNVTWSADCTPPVVNTAPTAPGAPVASASSTQGGFGLTWDASSDSQDDAFTYTLEGKDADDAGWQPIASGLTEASYDFADGTPAEGTWTYRVKAVESETSPALESGWSETSSAVVVDRTGPNAPTAEADRAAEYNDGTTNWWKDTVTVTYTADGDPQLPDASAGSGVASVSDAQTFSTAGAFSASGTAADHAGNVSAAATLAGAVDAAAPTVTPSCPSDVVLGSSAAASWTASDGTGGSGLAGASSGTVALATGSVGSKTVTIPAGTVQDNVGHASAAVTCNYRVIYSFGGFFQPVDMDRVNVGKAGSAIPVKFSLGGYQGLGVVTSAQFFISGGSLTGDEIEQTMTAGSSSLQYDATAGHYVYVWKTDKAWAGKSGTFKLTLNDGTVHTATFSFK